MRTDVSFVDVEAGTQEGILNYSIVSSDEEDPLSLKVKLKLSEKNNRIPTVVLKKNDNNEFIVTSRRILKPKKFEDFETEFCVGKKKTVETASPKKRKQLKAPGYESPTKKALEQICKALTDDFKLKSPLKVHLVRNTDIDEMNLRRTPSRASRAKEEQTMASARLSRTAKQHLNFNENDSFVDILCESIDSINVSTPKKRNASKATTEEDLAVSPRKKQSIANGATTPRGRSRARKLSSDEDEELQGIVEDGLSDTPRRSGRHIRAAGKVQDENKILSEKRSTRTPTRYADGGSPVRSVKKNLNESFRTQVLKQSVLKESTVSNRRCKPESFVQLFEDDSPQKKRVPRNRSVSISSDVSDKSDDFNHHKPKNVPDTPTRVLRSRSVSLSSNQSEDSVDIEFAPKTPIRRKTAASNQSETPSRRQTISSNQWEEPMDVPKTPSRRKTVASNQSETPSRRKTISNNQSEEAMDEAYVPKTPTRRKTQGGAGRSVAPSTPKTPSRLKLIRDGVITPSMQSRKSMVPANTTPLMKARNQLHVSYVPTDLPCREKEYLNVYNFLKGKLLDGCGGCMYVSGVPGTGKTATVTSVIGRLESAKDVPEFSYVSVNGMRLTEPKQAYVEIWKQLTGKTRPWEQAQNLLEERFTKKKNTLPIIMLVDELDILCTKRQDVVYNLLDWPSKSKGQLIVITIANTMDLPERLLINKVTSRLGLTRLTFQPYNHKQLMEIVTKRLTGTDSFNPDAVQLVARKVASVSGDARRALDICRRAAEIAEQEGKTQLVSIGHVDRALNAMITQPKVMAMKRCSRLEKLILQAIVAEVERTGVEETTFADVFKMLVSCCALDGFDMVSSTAAQRAVCQLSSCRLILTDPKCSDIFRKISLNVSVDEVYFALKK